jgi:uncharacterized membrane protein YfcA
VNWLDIAAFLALGFVAGTYGTLVGIGGGLIVVPILIFNHYPDRIAAGTSMVVVLGNALSGSSSFLRQRRVHVRAAIVFALAGIPGALFGALIDQHVPQRLFNLLFALLLATVGVRILTSRVADAGETAGAGGTDVPFSWAMTAAVGFFAGLVASIFGVGGGLIYVPTMVYLLGFLTHVATATSTFAIAITAVFATSAHAYFHDIRWDTAIAVACGAVAGGQVGAQIAARARSRQLLQFFSLAVFIAAAWLVYRSW